MKLRIKNVFMIAALLLLSSGCGIQPVPTEDADLVHSPNTVLNEQEEEEPKMSTEGETAKNHRDYQTEGRQVALVTDGGSAIDSGFNQAAYKGVQTYAEAAGISYSCYSADADTPDAYENTLLEAIEDNAELVVCVGSHFEQAVYSLQEEYDEIYFLLLDGVPRDSSGEEAAIADNVHCITYREEEAGYLAGYMAVLEGYTEFGFIGGERIASVQRYGYGYLQGIDDAASFLEVGDDIHVEYWYADTFLPDGQIEEVSKDWYQAGTQIIFACGGQLYESVLASAQVCDGKMIGADVDQSDISGLFLTSATKGIDSSIVVALDDFFASGRRWPEELAGNIGSYGAKEKCISLPVQDNAWRFKTATTNDYLRILAHLRSGDIQIQAEPDHQPEVNIMVIYHNQQEESDS